MKYPGSAIDFFRGLWLEYEAKPLPASKTPACENYEVLRSFRYFRVTYGYRAVLSISSNSIYTDVKLWSKIDSQLRFAYFIDDFKEVPT